MIWPELTIQICTYRRPNEIRTVITALHDMVAYEGKIKLVISDDHSGGTYLTDLQKWLKENITNWHVFTISETTKQSGWGANVNQGYQHCSDYIFFCEDDYVVTKPLNLTEGVALLLAHQGLGLMRYDGIVGHRLLCHLGECDLKSFLPHHKQSAGMGHVGKLYYWLLDSRSRETWLYSNRPHLKHKRFHKFYGLYTEGLKLGETEESFAHQVKDLMLEQGAPAIAALPDWSLSYFSDIGKSFQHSDEDV